MLTSHRARLEQKRLVKRLLLTITAAFASVVILIYVGLPLLARLVLLVSSVKSDTNTTVQENTLILPPILDPLPESTNSARVALSGYSAKESSVKVFVNGDEFVTLLADKDGKFESKGIPIKEGGNSIYVTSTLTNQESSPSATYQVIYKKGEPKLEIESPKDQDSFRDDQKEISIIGTTDQDNRIFINDRLVIVDTQGRFSYRVQLSDGENKFKIISLDDAGNKAEKEIKVTYSP